MEVKLGEILSDDVVNRDAVHVAILPVIANQKLVPGQDIGFVTSSTVRVGPTENNVGIVDPYLKNIVYPEQRFYMWMYPNTVTGMRHEWEHPSLLPTSVNSNAGEVSWEWIENFAQEHGITVDRLMEDAEYAYRTGVSKHDNSFESVSFHEFWPHFYNVTGYDLPENEYKPVYYCAC